MSWIRDTERTWLHKFFCRILKAGPIPKHVAFIMDGNRRYARCNGLSSALEGHALGFDTLAKTLEWCRDLGIHEVTVYAFSIENFKRSKTEVDGLMDLAREKFKKLLSEKEQIDKHGVRIRFFGNLPLLEEDIQSLMAEIELVSMHNDKAAFNVCVAYTSHDELSRAVLDIAQGIGDGLLEPDDVDERLIDNCLDSRHSPDPDLLIRTSGELRFSDFLLWQCSHCCIYFDDVLWPAYSFRNLCFAILHYQRNVNAVSKIKAFHCQLAAERDGDQNAFKQRRVEDFLQRLEAERQSRRLKVSGTLDNEIR